MDSPLEVFCYLGLAPFLHLLAVVFMLVSLATTSWMTSDATEEHFGLFSFCVASDCDVIDRNARITDTFRPIVTSSDARTSCRTEECVSWVATVESIRFLMAASLSCALFALVLSGYFAFRSMTSRSPSVGPLIIAMFCSVIALIMSSVSCDVYTREVYQVTKDANNLGHETGYSLALAATGGVLCLLGGGVSMVTGLVLRRQQKTTDHLLHAPPAKSHLKERDEVTGHVNWVARSRPPSLPTAGGEKASGVQRLDGGPRGNRPRAQEKAKLPPLPESGGESAD